MTCMDAMRGKSSILFHANPTNNGCMHVCIQLPAPHSSWKFPSCIDFNQLCFLSVGWLVANHRTWGSNIVPEIFPPYRDSSRWRSRGWITARRKVLAPAPPFPYSLNPTMCLLPLPCPLPGGFWAMTVFALAGKSLFEVRPTTVIIGGPAIRFAGQLQLQRRRK